MRKHAAFERADRGRHVNPLARLTAILLLPLALASCARDSPPVPAESYRNADALIASIASFDPARFAGRWYEVASFPTPDRQGCTDTQTVYTPAAGGLSVVTTCLRDGRPERTEGRARVTGPGRIALQTDAAPLPEQYWILWVDEGYRTAVIGMPSGRGGWILNRDPSIPPDRLAAAREILDFNGYDLSRLRMTPRTDG